MPNCGRSSRLKRQRKRRAAAAADAELDAVCASCGVAVGSAAGSWQEQRHVQGGPLHCVACWGDYESELPPNTPPARAGWWRTADIKNWLGLAWLEQSQHTIGGETFIALSARASEAEPAHFPGVGSTRPWPASKRLVLHLADAHQQLLPLTASAVVVELGAGACPLPGMWLARHAPHARIVLTDLPSLLPLTERNVVANFPVHIPFRISLVPLRWGCTSDLAQLPQRVDLVLAADCVYFEEDVPALFATLDALNAPTMLIALMPRDGQERRYDELVELAAAARGWQATRVPPPLAIEPKLAPCVLFELRRSPWDLWSSFGNTWASSERLLGVRLVVLIKAMLLVAVVLAAVLVGEAAALERRWASYDCGAVGCDGLRRLLWAS